MFGAARPAHLDHAPHTKPHSARSLVLRNLLLRLGFEERTRTRSPSKAGRVNPALRVRKSVVVMPKDYIRRRHLRRNIKTLLTVAVLSGSAAYVITRPTGGTGFSIPSEAQRRPAAQPEVKILPVPSIMDGAGYSHADGPLTVSEVSDLVLYDAKRNKDLHLRLFYPTKADKYPVIVFSHGAGGSQDCCDSLTRHWATYGYVTIQPTHNDSALQRRNAGEERIGFLQAVNDALKKPALWQSRPEDISFVLDSLPELQRRIPELGGEIDTSRIGLGGHSMGSYTAEAIAGALIDLPNHKRASFLDPRVRAVLCLSPQGPGQFGLTEHSFDHISLPYLGITGSLDSLVPVASPAWHKVPFDRSPPGDKYHLIIQGANHMSFISVSSASPARRAQSEAILGYTNSASLAFWDAYLKGDPAAKDYLASNRLETQSHNGVKLDRR
jgi:predicted dienelactone hydrolase